VTVPAQQIEPERALSLAAQVRDAAAEIAARLSHTAVGGPG